MQSIRLKLIRELQKEITAVEKCIFLGRNDAVCPPGYVRDT